MAYVFLTAQLPIRASLGEDDFNGTKKISWNRQAALPKIFSSWDIKGSPWCGMGMEKTFTEGEKEKYLFV